MLIINGRIYTMTRENPVIDCGYLRTNGSKITETGTMDELPKELLHKSSLIDAKGGWVLPGLIEAHCHIGITEEKQGLIADDCNEQTNPSTASLRAIDAVNPMDPACRDNHSHDRARKRKCNRRAVCPNENPGTLCRSDDPSRSGCHENSARRKSENCLR